MFLSLYDVKAAVQKTATSLIRIRQPNASADALDGVIPNARAMVEPIGIEPMTS